MAGMDKLNLLLLNYFSFTLYLRMIYPVYILRGLQSERVCKQKYHHRLSRKGYISLQDEEVRSYKLFPIHV